VHISNDLAGPPNPVFKVTAFLSRISQKFTIAHSEETIPNRLNGAMFGDLD